MRRLSTAAVSRQRSSGPIDNRPQLAKLPHNSALCLACLYARLPAVTGPLHFVRPHETGSRHGATEAMNSADIASRQNLHCAQNLPHGAPHCGRPDGRSFQS